MKVIRQTSQRGSQASKSLLRDSRQAPMTPAWSFSFDNTISESRLIRLSVYFRTAEMTGCSRKSPARDISPPMMTLSGLKILISFPILSPSCSPISSTSSMASRSSRLMALKMSSRVISSMVFSARMMDVSPAFRWSMNE